MRPPIGDVELVRVVGGNAGGADGEDPLVLALPGMFRNEITATLQLWALLGE